jgi:hypothetical protein
MDYPLRIQSCSTKNSIPLCQWEEAEQVLGLLSHLSPYQHPLSMDQPHWLHLTEIGASECVFVSCWAQESAL